MSISPLVELHRQLGEALQSDRHRLAKRLQQLSAQQRQGSIDEGKLDEVARQIAASREKARERASRIPPISFDPDLPITEYRQEILQLLATRQTIVVCGETGSGKSTQLPKICLEAGLGRRGWIGHTQPRRLAARSVASRVAEELSTELGQLVGFKIRFADAIGDQTLIKLMTDGVLLAEIQSDRYLDRYDAIIIDEAHERSLNIDFLLAYLHRLRDDRPDLKIIITSATIDAERFAAHFKDSLGDAPILQVSGRGYPVEVRYRPVQEEDELVDDDDRLSNDTFTGILRAYDELQQEPFGDILVFLPTERDIREASKRLKGHLTRRAEADRVEILPLYARLTNAEQQRIFQAHNKRRVVLATNVAESSLTVPGIRYVIDTGTARISRYAAKSKVQRLPIEAIARASADQRSGRCGRTAPGVCIRLFSEEDYNARARFTTPEIRRADLASVILQCKMLRLGELDGLPLLDPPSNDMVRDGYRTLHELGALDDRRELTQVGRQLGRIPLDPRVGRMILAAKDENCLAEVLIIAAALEGQDVRLRPVEHQQAADEAHAKFADPWSDFLSYLRLWDYYHHLRESLGSSRLQKALHQSFLSFHAFREWSDVQRQLREMLQESGINIPNRRLHLEPLGPRVAATDESRGRSGGKNRNEPSESNVAKRPDRPEQYAAIHRALMTGLLSGVGTQSEKFEYNGTDQLKFFLWPGSGLHAYRPKWIVAAELVETSRRYARTIAEIDPEWIEPLAQHVVKRSYSQPHWSEKAQSPMVYERVTLFGLPIVVGRRVQLAPIDPDLARELLVEHGLTERQLKTQAAFVRHNERMLDRFQELAQRTRDRALIIDRYQIQRFYQEHLPKEVTDRTSLEKWDREHRPKTIEKGTGQPSKKADSENELPSTPPDAPRVWMRVSDFVQETSTLDPREAFPDQIDVGIAKLPLAYRFEPGSEQDGISLKVPSVAVSQLSDDRLQWLVPGLLVEKIEALIRSLPKNLRRNLVPAPDVAAACARELYAKFAKEPFMPIVCKLLSEKSGERISESDFSFDKLPDHLRFQIEIIDEKGKPLAAGRDLKQLREQLIETGAIQPSEAVAAPQNSTWHRDGLLDYAVENLPETIPVQKGGITIKLFPGMIDLKEQVGLRLFDNKQIAERETERAILRLFAIKEKRELKRQANHLPGWSSIQLHASSLYKPEPLRELVGDLLTKIVFHNQTILSRNKAQYEQRSMEAARRIPAAVQTLTPWLPQLFERYHQARLALEKAPGLWREATDDVRVQLKWLLSPSTFQMTSWNWLQHLPRYVQAIVVRLEKLKTGGLPKDRASRLLVEPWWQDCIKRLESRDASAQVDADEENYRWMIEEYRVSLFAQQLGTSQPASEKRIKALKEILVTRPGSR